MKIVHISISDSGSGSSIAAYRLHCAMMQSGIDSNMLVLEKTKQEVNIVRVNFIERYIISKLGLYADKILNSGVDKRYGHFSFSIFGLRLARKKIIKNADVLYLHWINGGFMSLREIKNLILLKKKIIIVAHDMWAFTGGCHQSFGCVKFINECKKCPFYSSYSPIDFINQQFNEKIEIFSNKELIILAPSKKFFNYIESSNILGGKKIYHIPHVLDRRIFRKLGKVFKIGGIDVTYRKYIILFGAMGGKNNIYKGWSYFVDAISLLPKEITDELQVVLFGNDFSAEELISLPFQAISVGIINDEIEMAKLYNIANAYIFPSLYESFGQTVLESIACDTPVVGFDVGIIGDIINHKKNGYIAKYRDSIDLAAGINYVLGSESLTSSNIIFDRFFDENDIIAKHRLLWSSFA